jgi:putative DNA primase/helicase
MHSRSDEIDISGMSDEEFDKLSFEDLQRVKLPPEFDEAERKPGEPRYGPLFELSDSGELVVSKRQLEHIVGRVAETERRPEFVRKVVDALGVLSEDKVAQEFAERYRDKLLYCHSSGKWHVWNGTHWAPNSTKRAFHYARELARELSQGANASVSKVAFAFGVERFAIADPVFAVTADKWNTDPYLLGTPSGTVDLRTGSLRPAEPREYITKLTAVAPAETADCPLWLRFLSEATKDDPAMVRFLQQWGGYNLTGNIREHALAFLLGSGGNGKSTFLEVFMGILGDYAVTAAMDTFTSSKHERHPTDLALLAGARMVTASETEEGRHWAESRIKQITGGDAITARFMRQDFFTYHPQFKLTIIGNHMPNLRNVDDAIKRRFNLVPFFNKPAVPDKDLADKLRKEWPGILRWMINGCLDWQRNGLTPAPAIATATAEYFSDQDIFSQWLAEYCDHDPGNEFKTEYATPLFQSWTAFAKAAGEEPGSAKALKRRLTGKGCEKKDTKQGTMYLGIRLKRMMRDD